MQDLDIRQHIEHDTSYKVESETMSGHWKYHNCSKFQNKVSNRVLIQEFIDGNGTMCQFITFHREKISY